LSKKLPGYRGEALKFLQRANVNVEDLVRITKDGKTYEGILIPRSEYGDDKHILIKLKTGYNIGIRLSSTTEIQKLGVGEKLTFTQPPQPKTKPGLPNVVIVSTGGTIASRVDYRTGGVTPALSANDLYAVVPELSDIAVIQTEVLFSIFSEDMTPRHWSALAKAIAKHITQGVSGVVVAHGTDTMGYTAAALSFALQDLPVPVILVGAQRSSDRPSSDAALNLIGAVVAAANAPFAEVVLAMHKTPSDEAISLHRGTKVRKCHTSRRDAFKSINAQPIAEVRDQRVILLTEDYRRRDPNRKLLVKPDFEEKVALLKFHPGFEPKLVEWLLDSGYKGIILEGTGLGHVSHQCFSALKRARDLGVFVGMTSQCLWGRVNMNVYDTGRDLLAQGVVPLGDMLPETALVKLMWALGQTKDYNRLKEIMVSNIAYEISSRSLPPLGDM
jgi:glutamyl-tRNA(Gln) amidotransferase subunit D